MSCLTKASNKRRLLLATLLSCFVLPSYASLTVWIDFNTDWETRLEEVADNAEGGAIAHFSAGERGTLEANIISEMERVYADYQINFVTVEPSPGTDHDVVEFGDLGPSANTLGEAPSLRLSNAYHSETPGNSAKIYTAAFWRYVENADSRATQIDELSATLAGTAAHELGHSLGLQHNHAYGSAGITPDNFANTGGIQNNAIIATGSTGLTEAGRETARSLSRWERAMLDFGGGGVFGGPELVNNAVFEEGEGGDAGATAGTAKALTLTTGETSGLELAHLRGDLDAATTDIDTYSFNVASAGWLTAEIMSFHLYGTGFDPTVSIFDTDGVSLLASNDDGTYNSNVYNSGEFPGSGSTPPYGNEDSYLPNVFLDTGGTYYIQVSATTDAAIGDDYTLLAGFAAATGSAAPEPSSLFLALMGASLLRHTRKKKLQS